MAWSALPCTSGEVIRAAWFDEIRAAITERTDVVGGSPPDDVGSGDLIQLRGNYRAAVESLIPSYYAISGTGTSTDFTVWTKATIMTEAFGGGVTDWPNLGDTILRAQDFNDMRTILNLLLWHNLGLGTGYGAGYEGGSLGQQSNDPEVCEAYYNNWATEFAESNSCYSSRGYLRVSDLDPDLYRLALYNKWATIGGKVLQSIKKCTMPDLTLANAVLICRLSNKAQIGGGDITAAVDRTWTLESTTTGPASSSFDDVLAVSGAQFGSITCDFVSDYAKYAVTGIQASLVTDDDNWIVISTGADDYDDFPWPDPDGGDRHWLVGCISDLLFLRTSYDYVA